MNEMHRLNQVMFYIRESPTLGVGFLMVGAVLLFGFSDLDFISF